MFLSIQTPNVNLVDLDATDDWNITYHRLFNLSPDDAPNAKVIGEEVSIWDVCFTLDLFQAISTQRMQLLDIGWAPHADPNGQYVIRIIRLLSSDLSDRDTFDWFNPLLHVETRSLGTLIDTIHSILGKSSN